MKYLFMRIAMKEINMTHLSKILFPILLVLIWRQKGIRRFISLCVTMPMDEEK